MILQVAKSLGICVSDAVKKAEELSRLVSVRIPGGLGAGEACKTAVCLELACTMVYPGKSLGRSDFQRYGFVSSKVYNNTFNMVQKVLSVSMHANIQELAVQFGCVRIAPSIQQCLATYRDKFLASLSELERKKADFSRPVFAAAAFYLVARKHKVKVDKNRLLQQLYIAGPDFTATVTNMQQLCHDLVGTSNPTAKKTATNKRNRQQEEDVEAEHTEPTGNNDGAYGLDDNVVEVSSDDNLVPTEPRNRNGQAKRRRQAEHHADKDAGNPSRTTKARRTPVVPVEEGRY